MLLTNGRIYTMDAAGTVVDSLVIRDGRVVFAGRRADVNSSPGEAMVDLGGRAVLPGLVDGHGHLMLLAKARLELDLGAANSEEDIATMVGAAAARRRPGEWIAGRGWDQTRWPGQRFPTRASLDRVAPGVKTKDLNNLFSALDRAIPGLGKAVQQNANVGVAAGINSLGTEAELEGKKARAFPLRFVDGAVFLGPLRVGLIPPLF
jgi:hypothetical protein